MVDIHLMPSRCTVTLMKEAVLHALACKITYDSNVWHLTPCIVHGEIVFSVLVSDVVVVVVVLLVLAVEKSEGS